MDIATLARRLSELGVFFRFAHGSNGVLQWRDSEFKSWREISRLDLRMLLQILNVKDPTLLQAAAAFLADKGHRLSSEYAKKRN